MHIEIRKYLSKIGKRGGKVVSDKKIEASLRNLEIARKKTEKRNKKIRFRHFFVGFRCKRFYKFS